jgi:hypothetical protein
MAFVVVSNSKMKYINYRFVVKTGNFAFNAVIWNFLQFGKGIHVVESK